MRLLKLVCAAIAGLLMTAAVAAGGAAPAGSAAQATIDSPQPNNHPQADIPKVENCGLVGIGSPSRYVCDGKVYTSFHLAELRQNGRKKSDNK